MQTQTITDRIKITQGTLADYKKLSRFHYRDSRLGPFEKIFVAKAAGEVAGVIVYSMPVPSIKLRNVATNNYFTGLGRRTLMTLVNKSIRTISRVIVEPRFRSLGLAVRLVRETMPMMNVPIIESLAVMGHVNPFFEKAGMKAYKAPMSAKCVRMIEALSLVGIDGDMFIDAGAAHLKLQKLSAGEQMFIEREITSFLSAYTKKKYIPADLDRTQFVLSKLTRRPVYYIWLNPAFDKS